MAVFTVVMHVNTVDKERLFCPGTLVRTTCECTAWSINSVMERGEKFKPNVVGIVICENSKDSYYTLVLSNGQIILIFSAWLEAL